MSDDRKSIANPARKDKVFLGVPDEKEGGSYDPPEMVIEAPFF